MIVNTPVYSSMKYNKINFFVQIHDSKESYMIEFKTENDFKEFALMMETSKIEGFNPKKTKKMNKLAKTEDEEKVDLKEGELPALKEVDRSNLMPPLTDPLPPLPSNKKKETTAKVSPRKEEKEKKGIFQAFTIALRKNKKSSDTKRKSKKAPTFEDFLR